ncbi:uncharacterized protein LOC111106872 [Crassostrea virginica]
MFEPAPVIVDEVLEEFADPRAADAALSTYDNMTRNCNRIRQKLRPGDPTDMNTEKVPLQVKLVSEGKLKRHQKKKTVWIQGKLFQLWQEYADKTISVSRLLKRCGSVYGPTPSVEM